MSYNGKLSVKSARIVGVLQDWDLYGDRYDIERVNVDVPPSMLEKYSSSQVEDMREGTDGFNNADLMELFHECVNKGIFRIGSKWEAEDPCKLHLEITYGEEWYMERTTHAYDHCPRCKSGQVEATKLMYGENRRAVEHLTCNNCGLDFVQLYQYVSTTGEWKDSYGEE